MSDFLNNLAAKALRRHDPVRPRLASLFEPPDGALAPLPSGPSEPETTTYGQTFDAPSTIRTPSPSEAPQREAFAPAHEPAVQPPAPATPHPDPSAVETARTSREAGTTGQAAPPGHEHEPASERRPHLTPTVREAEAPQPQGLRPAPTRQVEVVRRENRAPVGREVNVRRVGALAGTEGKVRELEGRIASLEASLAGESGRREPLAPASGAATPTTTSHAAAPPVPTAAAPPAPSRGVERRDEPPHVTVTIGRVDVRAVFTAPPATARPPAPRPAQKTTLADYLKQRERGRR